ncbi:AAA family ATPase [Streptomyces huasconensis]|uniref:AAA family ATPase n=1 Tax=Streptomyces huasconensis TaxID=1854574 RepID=A0ABV3LSG0_9ACTN
MRTRGDGEDAARPERSGGRAGGPDAGGAAVAGSARGGLVGRAEELAALRRLLAQGRLVTVVGGAGMGKSLLVEHVAAAVGGSLPDGVVRVRWWDGGRTRRRTVVQTVAEVLDGEVGPGEDSAGPSDSVGLAGGGAAVGAAQIAACLRSRRMLLVLDDFDPVRVECVRLVRALLEEAPEVRVLAAGRHPLGLGDETVLRLGPLAVAGDAGQGVRSPADADAGTYADVSSEAGPAVVLFLERVRAARRGSTRAGLDPGPAGTGDDLSSYARTGPAPRPGAGTRPDGDPPDLRAAREICRRLEGVPLAIELAAAQAVDRSLGRLARMLESGQGWLAARGAPLRRHRSLRAAVGSGYALCGTAERTVWARLSVFAGDFDEDAAVFVCGGGGLGAQDVPAALARLVLASVVEPVHDPGGVLTPRFRMSAAVREFGAERLRSAGEAAAAISRHLYWHGHVASTAHHLWSTGLHEQATALVRDGEADLCAALTRQPSGADQASMALALAVDLWFWWALCGNAREGREHLLRLLPLGRTDTPVCGQALWLAGWLAVCTGSPDAADLLGQAWRVALLAGDDATVGRVCHVLGALALDEGRTERAIAHLREAADTIPAHAEHGPPAAVSWALLAVAQAQAGRPRDARRSVRRALAGSQPRHDLWTRCMTQYAQALVDHLRGRRSRAWRRAHKALAGAIGMAGAARAPVARRADGGGAALLAGEAPGAADGGALPAVTTMAGPPGVALVHQLIADIAEGRPPKPCLTARRGPDR